MGCERTRVFVRTSGAVLIHPALELLAALQHARFAAEPHLLRRALLELLAAIDDDE
jgi:hypothetical protein